MKLLALSDLHSDYSHVESISEKAGDFDAVLLAGDITNFGHDERALELLKMFKQPVLAVPGNCDNPSLLNVLDKKTISLHNAVYTLQGFNFIGLGGSNPTPFQNPVYCQAYSFVRHLHHETCKLVSWRKIPAK